MQRRGGGGRLRLPLVASNPIAMNASSRRRYPAGSPSSGSFRTLAVVATITIFVVVGVFLKYTPSKALLASCSKAAKAACTHGEERTWHGGHPAEDRPGSCWCGGDGYCMCTPSLAIDIVLHSRRDNEVNVWVVRRKDTGQLATIGGFVDVGETTESAVLREAAEETGIIIPPEQAKYAMKLIGVYSDPRRDNRRAIASVAYALELTHEADHPKAGDDAKEVVSVSLAEVGVKYKGEDFYADHLTILLDFKEQQFGSAVRNGELYNDVARSTCSPTS